MKREAREIDVGSGTLLVFALILPILFILGSLALDVGKFFTEYERYQQLIDSAALHGSRFLPYQQRAHDAVVQLLRAQNVSESRLDIRIAGDAVQIVYLGETVVAMSDAFGIPMRIPFRIVSVAKTNYRDAMVVVDNSSVLAPPLYDNSGNLSAASWGDPISWPAARIYTAPLLQGVHRGAIADPRLLTQQCHNPAFTAIKLAAVGAVDYLSGLTGHQVAVAFAPAAVGADFLARPVAQVPANRNGQSGGGGSEANIERFRNDILRYGDEYCLALVQEECILNQPCSSPYAMPQLLSGVHVPLIQTENAAIGCRNANGEPTCPIENVSWRLKTEYDEQRLTSRTAIWSRSIQRRAAALNSPESPSYLDLAAVLRDVEFALTQAPTVAARRGLAGEKDVVREALFILGDVPRDATGARYPNVSVRAGVEAALDAIQNDAEQFQQRIRVTFALLRHEGNAAWFDSAFSQFSSDLAGRYSPSEYFRVSAVQATDGRELAERSLSQMLLRDRTGVLSF